MLTLIARALLLCCLALAMPVQAWTDKPVRLLVPAPAGGSMDVLARLLGQKLSAEIRQPVIVENRPGAGGIVGIQALLQAPADGQTLMVTANNVLVEIPHVLKTPYDPLRDVRTLATFARSGLVLVAAPPNGPADFKTLMGQLQARADKASFASYSPGTTSQYAGLILNQKAGLHLQHIPFAGSPPALQQVMAGQIDFMFDGIATSLPLVRSGKLKAYGFTGKARSPHLPEVPTMTELGYPDIQFMGWLGVIAASTMTPETARKVSATLLKVADAADFRERLLALGLEPDVKAGSAALNDELREVSAKNADIVRQFNIRLN